MAIVIVGMLDEREEALGIMKLPAHPVRTGQARRGFPAM
jgi:hypothetical protein